jgi:hypothetical protein
MNTHLTALPPVTVSMVGSLIDDNYFCRSAATISPAC